jgi:translocation protein SEC66
LSCADKGIQANAFAPNWGQTIFQSASEMTQNNQIRERLSEILSTSQAEREWWEKRKATIQSDFMKELDDEKVVKSPAESSYGGSVKGARIGSDDDAVIVEGGGPAEKAAKAKKKKGKQ